MTIVSYTENSIANLEWPGIPMKHILAFLSP